MTKPNQQRTGLQKQVSSVFKGVPIPGRRPAEETSRLLTPAEESEGMIVLGPPIIGSPAASAKASAEQSLATEEHDSTEKSLQEAAPKRTVGSEPSASTSRQTAQSPLMIKRLAQSDEQEDAIDCPPSILAEPEILKGVIKQPGPVEEQAEQAIPKEQVCPKPSAPTNVQSSPSSLMRKLAQSEESAGDVSPKRAASSHAPLSTNRQTSQRRKIKNVRQPEAPAAATSPAKHPLADSLADGSDEGGLLQQIKEKLIPSQENGRSAKDRVMVMLVPILAVVMVFTLRQVLHKSSAKAKGADKQDKTVVAAVKSSDEIEWKIPDPLPAMTRDPLKLPEPEATENPDQGEALNPKQDTSVDQAQTSVSEVRAIVYSEDKASALIGGHIVHAGSKINDVTIVKINRDSVEFERNGETWVQGLRD